MEKVSETPAAPVNTISSLQVVRGFAAILVVLDHSIENIGVHTGSVSPYQNLGFQCGRFGVLVFFTISGFIMFYTSYNKQGPRLTTSKFLFNRFRRIVPLYWIVTALVILLIVIKTRHLPGFFDIIGSMFFLPLSTSFGERMYPLVGQGWTLYYEMFFYFVFSLCLNFKKFNGLYICIIFMLSLVATNILWALFGYQSMPGILRFYTQPIIVLFVVGLIIGICRLHVPYALRLQHPLMIAGGITVLALWQYWVFVNTTSLPVESEILYYVLAACCVVVCVYAVEKQQGGLRRAGIFLGNASYSIYLIHNLVVGPFAKFFFAYFGPESANKYLLIAMIAGVSLGCLVHLIIERPITSVLSARHRQRPNAVRGSEQIRPT